MTAPPMPVYRGWTRGQLQLFVPVGKGETWTGYVTTSAYATNTVLTRGYKHANNIPTPVLPPAERRDWRHSAACRDGIDPDAFFPPNGSRTDLDSPAKERCGGCPVQADCLEWALGTRQRFGIYGGATRHERRRIARTRAIANGKAAAVNKDEAQDWLRRNAADPFIVEQIAKLLVIHGPDITGTYDASASAAMLALADLLDEADA